MPNESEQRADQRAFRREARAPIKTQLKNGRFFEQTAEERAAAENAKARPKTTMPFPIKPLGRGSIVERDNEAAFLQFHYNPSSYTIRKAAGWGEKRGGTSTPTLEWQGPGLTEVRFELLFDDLWPYPSSSPVKNTEQSLEWLFERCENQRASQRGRSVASPSRRRGWMNTRYPDASNEPPVLVLFGVSYPFECRLLDVNITTIFQGGEYASAPGPAATVPGASGLSGVGGFRRFEQLQRDQQRQQQLREQAGRSMIKRASVQITLKQYYSAPQVERKGTGRT